MDQGEQTCLHREVRLRSSTNSPNEEVNEQRNGFAGALRRRQNSVMPCLSSDYRIRNLTCSSQPLTMTSRGASPLPVRSRQPSGEVRASGLKRNPSTDFSRQSCGKTIHKDRSSWMWMALGQEVEISGWDPTEPLPPKSPPHLGKGQCHFAFKARDSERHAGESGFTGRCLGERGMG